MIGEEVQPREGRRVPLTRVQGSGSWDLAVQDPRTGLTRRFLPIGPELPAEETRIWWLADVIDRNGNNYAIHRDADGAPSRIVHSGGYQIRIDTASELGEETGELRITTLALADAEAEDSRRTVLRHRHDEAGDLTHVVNSSGRALVFGYDAEHRMTSWTDRNNSTYRYVYDEAGRAVQGIGPGGCLTATLVYGPTETGGTRTTRYTDSQGCTTAYRVNRLGQVVAVTDPLSHTVFNERDRWDRILSITDALGNTLATNMATTAKSSPLPTPTAPAPKSPTAPT